MRKLLAIALVLLTVAGCEPRGAPPPASGPDPAIAAAQERACAARGGRWGEGNRPGFFVCYEPTRDAGKFCQAAGDCEGMCLARSRTCSPVRPMFGCHSILLANGAPGTVCIE